MTGMISEFKGAYHFLSNFHVEKAGKTTEHYFQLNKTLDPVERQWVLDAPTPGEAKKRGQKVTMRPDWEMIKDNVMYRCLLAKFVGDPDLEQKLLDTGTAFLSEGNYWGDKYWGVDIKTGEGQNRLGYLLMALRSSIAYRRAEEARKAV